MPSSDRVLFRWSENKIINWTFLIKQDNEIIHQHHLFYFSWQIWSKVISCFYFENNPIDRRCCLVSFSFFLTSWSLFFPCTHSHYSAKQKIVGLWEEFFFFLTSTLFTVLLLYSSGLLTTSRKILWTRMRSLLLVFFLTHTLTASVNFSFFSR
jgi:hypothetical protein